MKAAGRGMVNSAITTLKLHTPYPYSLRATCVSCRLLCSSYHGRRVLLYLVDDLLPVADDLTQSQECTPVLPLVSLTFAGLNMDVEKLRGMGRGWSGVKTKKGP